MLPHQSPGDSARTKALLEVMLGADHVEVPREAVRETYNVVRRCTENDVAGMAGFLAWGLPLRHMRDKLCPSGWHRDRSGNYERVVSPDRKFAITSARGDHNTGIADKMPSTYTDKGPRTKDAVEANRQLGFDPRIIGEPSVTLLHKDMPTFFLLSYQDVEAQEIRMELSIPVEFTPSSKKEGKDERGIATRFDHRLILEPILLEDSVIGDGSKQEHVEEEIDIPVPRRSS